MGSKELPDAAERFIAVPVRPLPESADAATRLAWQRRLDIAARLAGLDPTDPRTQELLLDLEHVVVGNELAALLDALLSLAAEPEPHDVDALGLQLQIRGAIGWELRARVRDRWTAADIASALVALAPTRSTVVGGKVAAFHVSLTKLGLAPAVSTLEKKLDAARARRATR